MSIIIEKGNAVCVDHNNYDLSLDGAAKELYNGNDIIAREFEDFDDDYSFPDVFTLSYRDYEGMTLDEIIESIREYESFGRAS
jgi:hypothetical protein